MLGFGESKDEVCELFDDLREYDCDILTIGQYLSPSKQHYPVQEYISPELFKVYREIAVKKGFIYVTSDPLVRSSYNADAFFVLDKNNC
jgi:lipoic acid synthetase